MCGIVGIINFNGKVVDKVKLINMNNLLYHRGPDFGDIFIDNNVGLGHRRLSIIDLSNKANQPMNYKDTPYWIVYNGEIYNYIEIKEELIKKGYKFETKSDTEVILASYIEWGEDCFHKFNGMWALSIYNQLTKEMIISRDRYGKKPLYYYVDTDLFLFASEKKAIVLSEFVDLEFDKRGIKTALYNPFVLEASGFTEFKNVKNLLPGHLIKIKGHNVNIKRWYKLLERIDQKNYLSFDEKVERFIDLFADACRLRLRADVPIATSLSGGLDSSSVVAMLSNVGEIKHKAFVHAFKNTPLDEVEYAKIVADTINIPLEIVEIDKKDITDSIDNIIYYFESVYGGMPDSAYRIYNAQKKEGFKISIDGHGADEMLGGYGWYLDELQKDVPILNIFKHLEILQHRKEMTLDKKARSKRSLLKFGYERLPKNLQKKIKNVIKGNVVTELYDYEKDELPDGWTHLKQRLYEDFSYTILPRILKNFDAVSMANSIEVRMPFLDYRLVEFVFSLNNDDLIQKKWTKYILRKAMEGILDERVVWRKDKKGFNSPVADMLSKELKEWTIDAISHADEELFDKKELQKDFETKILAYRSWDESLKFWTKINTIKLMNIYKKKKEQKNA